MTGRYQEYPRYKDSGVEWLEKLPRDWHVMKVKFLLKDGSEGIKIGPFGSALKLEDMVQKGIRVYGQENVIKRDFTLGKRFISEKKYNEMKVYTADAGDILITMMGTSGKCQVVPIDADLGIIDSHLLKIRTNKRILPELFRLLVDEAQEVQDQIGKQGKGSIMHGLNSTIVKDLEFPLPSVSEQRKILNFLDLETAKIDTLIAKQEKLIELLKEKRQAVISHAVTRGLNPNAPMKDSGVEWLGEVPEHWIVSPLKYYSKMQGGFAFSSGDFSENGIQLLKIANVYQNKLALERQPTFLNENYLCSHKDFVVANGDILMSLTGTLGKQDYGFAVLVENNNKFLLNQRVAKINAAKANLLQGYLLFSLWSDSYLSQLYSLPSGTKQANLSNDDVMGIVITFPSTIKEQEEVIEYVDAKLRRFKLLNDRCIKKIELLKERKTALISAAVTGKIDVRGWQAPVTGNEGSHG